MSDTTPPPPLQLPRLRLDFFETAVIMTRREDNGQTTSYPVAVQDVVSACTEIALGSGFLPPNTLFWKQQADKMTLGLYIPARRWQVRTGKKQLQVPMPPLVFVGKGGSYSIFAVKKRPLSERAPLYHVPAPNVFNTGGICQGNTPFPLCSAQNMMKALTLFWEDSLFNGHLSRGKCKTEMADVRKLWRKLNGKKRFPLSELMPMNKTLRSLI